MDGSVRSYQDLDVWRKGLDLVMACYRVTAGFPKEERFGLTNQLQRATVSVPANIAEGQGRWYTKELARHLSNAHGSQCECETHLHVAVRLGYVGIEDAKAVFALSKQIGRMLNGLKRALERRADEQTGRT